MVKSPINILFNAPNSVNQVNRYADKIIVINGITLLINGLNLGFFKRQVINTTRENTSVTVTKKSKH